MTDADRLHYEALGRACVLRYGTEQEIAEMCARRGEKPPEREHRPLTNAALLKVEIMRAHGHGTNVIAKAIGLPKSMVRQIIWPNKKRAA